MTSDIALNKLQIMAEESQGDNESGIEIDVPKGSTEWKDGKPPVVQVLRRGNRITGVIVPKGSTEWKDGKPPVVQIRSGKKPSSHIGKP
ncbi:MAG: hypothetical protein HY381_00045 [Candidatus Chisholmbacteria bacterium]|nr:hypothetical protein [Candidatus Chisholmbacteria bacterium]